LVVVDVVVVEVEVVVVGLALDGGVELPSFKIT
jgi:hypothetical protein